MAAIAIGPASPLAADAVTVQPYLGLAALGLDFGFRLVLGLSRCVGVRHHRR